MSKQISITLRDHVYNSWLKDYKGNKSAFVEENFIKGLEIENAENYKLKYIELTKANRELEENNKKLKAKIGRLENQQSPQKKLTPNQLYTEEEFNLFEEMINKNDFKKRLMQNTIRSLDKDQNYFDTRLDFWNNETGEELSPSDFNIMIVMFRKIIKKRRM